jgi:UDP-GlcNAc:undecaprenyl-phosphate GlcNAc-1-phosphate transferase
MAGGGGVTRLLLGGALAFGLAWWGTPIARAAALRFGIVDRPDGRLKRQEEPVPYLGGLAVYLPFLVALCLVHEFDQRALGLLLAGTLMLLLGLIDDLGALSPPVKLAGQGVACWVLLKSDVMIHIVWLPAWAQAAITVLWILTAANAFNLIDILDGLAPGVAALACLSLLAATHVGESPGIPVMAAALAGSLLGFLRYNFAPARIYLGDSGSLFLGMMLGALTMTAQYTANNRLGFLSPLLILGLPLFDTAFVSAVRLARGASPFRGSPDHFPLRLRRLGMSVPGVAWTCYAAAAGLGALALANVRLASARASGALLAAAAGAGLAFALALLWQEARNRRLSGPRREKGIRSRRLDAPAPGGAPGGEPG